MGAMVLCAVGLAPLAPRVVALASPFTRVTGDAEGTTVLWLPK